MGRRSNALADRIEQGAAELAKFAESLSDADWKKPGSKHCSASRSWPSIATTTPASTPNASRAL